MSYENILKANVFKNAERFADGQPLAGGKPNFSNNKITLHTAIAPGEYSLGVWQYADTGNLSLSLTTKAEQSAQPAMGDSDDDFS